ncbi:hypothetical protein RZS08_39025, partial [Arthrospira platensis SPKY1]|nr:hypothetical protein [Arthrospira platensis SPKY1]
MMAAFHVQAQDAALDRLLASTPSFQTETGQATWAAKIDPLLLHPLLIKPTPPLGIRKAAKASVIPPELILSGSGDDVRVSVFIEMEAGTP